MKLDIFIYKYFWHIDFDDFIIKTKKSFKIKLAQNSKKNLTLIFYKIFLPIISIKIRAY